MADQEIVRIRSAFDGVKTEMADLKASLHEINDALEAERFVSSDMIGALGEVVKRYREQASALESIGAELSIPIGEDITEIDNAIRLYEQKLSSQYIRNLVLDYFRLTAEAADVKMVLEDSKRKLMEKCAVDLAELPSAIEPYGAVVNHIRSGERRLSDEDYDLVEDHIGKSVARATERGDLTIDEMYDISTYLDDSCDILATNDGSDNHMLSPGTHNDSFAQANHDSDTAEASEPPAQEDIDVEKVSSEADADESQAGNAPVQDTFLQEYHGIAGGVTVTISGNAPASALKAGEYKNLCREKPEVPVAMFWLGHEKIQDKSQRVVNSVEYYAPDPAIVDYLVSHEYFCNITVECGLFSKNYLTLSGKGWACYTKQDVVKYLSSGQFSNKERAREFVLPIFLQFPAETWDEQAAIALTYIHEFFAEYSRNYQAYRNPHNGIVCADLIKDKNVRVCSGVFVEGFEPDCISSLREQLNELQGNDILIIIVNDKQDIQTLVNTLGIASSSVMFSVAESSYTLLTAQGEEAVIDALNPAVEETADVIRETDEQEEAISEEATISPRIPLKSVKLPSEQKLKDVLRNSEQVTLYMFHKLNFTGLESEEHIHQVLDSAFGRDYISQQITLLESKGYLSVYSYQGKNIVSPTPLVRDILSKPSLMSMIKRLMKPDAPALPTFVSADEMPLSEFKAHYDLACLYLDFIDGLNERKSNLSVIRTGTWLHDKEYYVMNRRKNGSPEKKLRLVSADDYLQCVPESGEGVVCRAAALPAVTSEEDDCYYCMCDAIYEWNGSKWVNALDKSDAPSELLSVTEEQNRSKSEVTVSSEADVTPAVDAQTDVISDDASPMSDAPAIIEQTEAPEEDHAITVDPSKKEKIRQYLDGAWHMLKAGRTDVASVMLKSLVYRDPELKTLADQFAYATGDPAMEGSPNSQALGIVFSIPAGNDPVADTFAAAAYLRMYFSSAASDQNYLSRDFSHQKDNLALKRFPDLDAVLYDLSNWVKYQYRGLDAELIELLLRSQDTGVRQRALQQRAQDALSSHLTESSHSNKKIKRTRDLLFASGSDIWKVLTGIKESNPDTRPLAESIVAKGVDKTIDDAWDEANRQLSFSRSERCIGVERTTLSRQLRNIMALIKEWLSVNITESRISNAQTQAAEQLIQSLKPKMEDALKALTAVDTSVSLEQQAAEAVLREAVKQCLDRISGASTQEEQTREYYINLLKEPLIALDDLDQPHIETPMRKSSLMIFAGAPWNIWMRRNAAGIMC